MVDRIVSLAPSATNILQALGVEERLVAGTSHGSTEAAVGGWLTPDIDQIVARGPDLVVATDQLQDPIVERLEDRDIRTLHVSPTRLEAVYESIEQIGEAVGQGPASRDLVQSLQDRIAQVKAQVAGRDRPVVYCEEWADPPMAAGNWVPEIVEAAGGRYPFREPGERSGAIDRAMVEEHAPDDVVVHLCGKGTDVDPSYLAERGWEIPAIRDDRIHVIDDSLLNQPGPNLATATESLAELLHPDAVHERGNA